jgi:hypothetical protein
MPIAGIYFQLTQYTNVGLGFPFHNQSLHHTSRFFFRGFLLHIRTKTAKASTSSSELDIFQVQTGACSSVFVPCGGEGILCVLVQKDCSYNLVKLAVSCVATLRDPTEQATSPYLRTEPNLVPKRCFLVFRISDD